MKTIGYNGVHNIFRHTHIAMVKPWPIEIEGLPNFKMDGLCMENC